VRFGSRERGLAIVDASGTVIDPPESELARGVTSELAVDAEGASVVVDARGALVAFEPDGRVRWELATNNRADAAPVLGADGTIYVASFGGTLAAYGS
jgi:outer membrane protein assembly factor BamB